LSAFCVSFEFFVAAACSASTFFVSWSTSLLVALSLLVVRPK
jgi:hypothetical protein